MIRVNVKMIDGKRDKRMKVSATVKKQKMCVGIVVIPLKCDFSYDDNNF